MRLTRIMLFTFSEAGTPAKQVLLAARSRLRARRPRLPTRTRRAS
jgi:hypothetical protein